MQFDSYVLLLGVDAGVFCLLTGGGFAFLGVGCSQPNADSMLIDLEPKTSLFIIFNHPAEIGIGGRIGS